MGITLDISLSTPLSEEDDRILAGLAMVVMGIANRNQTEPATGCGQQDPSRQMFYCVGEPEHRGRHTYHDFGEGEVN